MKIQTITVYHLNLPLIKPYYLSGGRLKFEQLDSTFIKITTDNGLVGWGEGCPWGHTYLPEFGGGVRAAAELIAPALIGMDPRRHEHINRVMDLQLPGHYYAKSPFDIACWDIAGQSAQLPIVDLLGGHYEEPTPIASSVSTGSPEAMLATIQGFRDMEYFVHSVKIGADVEQDIQRIRHLEANRKPGELFFYDVNRAWLPSEAITVMNQVQDLPIFFEQPCETLLQCEQVRRQTRQPISIDENLIKLDDLQWVIEHRVGEIINIKVSRVGGLTRARKLRDLALNAGFKILIMDTGGTVIADTAVQHLAQSIPAQNRIGTWLCQEMITVDVAPRLGSRNRQGCSAIPANQVGLGVAPDESLLGEPVAVYRTMNSQAEY